MFEGVDAILLARIQFGFTIAFHIIFPGFSIGLASYLAVLEGLFLKTHKPVYLSAFNYWIKPFAVTFGMGVVSGLVMSYQFGTNWSVFSDKAGPIIGPLMGYEVLTAFFLEAGFLGIMLFGMKKVGIKLHFLATVIVAIGTLLSAFWILSANSWMQTPVGFDINAEGQFIPLNWWEIIFNPSFPYRLVHMVLAAYLTTAFVVGATGAFHLLRDRHNEAARLMFSMAMWMAAVVAPIQIVAGDLHGLNTLEHQPAKIAAMEGHFDTYEDGAPLVLFGIPDMEEAEIHSAIAIPKLGSLILRHSLDGRIDGLDQWDRELWPNVEVLFWSFRVMLAIGFLMAFTGAVSLYLRWRHKLFDAPRFWRWSIVMGPMGFVAIIAGWITTEVGRQPFTVYGFLRTAESVSPISAEGVASSLIAFIVIYFLVFGAGTFYLLRLMAKKPDPDEAGLQAGEITHAAGITPITSIRPRKTFNLDKGE